MTARPIILGALLGIAASVAIGPPDRPSLADHIAALRAAGCTTDTDCGDAAARLGIDPVLLEMPRGTLAMLCGEAVDDACTYLDALGAADVE